MIRVSPCDEITDGRSPEPILVVRLGRSTSNMTGIKRLFAVAALTMIIGIASSATPMCISSVTGRGTTGVKVALNGGSMSATDIIRTRRPSGQAGQSA